MKYKTLSKPPPRPWNEETKFACKNTIREIPLSEVHSQEAEEYVLYLYGLECFYRWRKHAEQHFPNPKNG